MHYSSEGDTASILTHSDGAASSSNISDTSPGPARHSNGAAAPPRALAAPARYSEREMLLPCTCEISTATRALRALSRKEQLRGGEVSLIDAFCSQIILPLQSLLEIGMRKASTPANLSEGRAGTCSGDLCTDTALKNTAERGNTAAARSGDTERATEGFYEMTIKEQKNTRPALRSFYTGMVFVLLLPSCCTPCSEHLWVQSSNPEVLIWISQQRCSII